MTPFLFPYGHEMTFDEFQWLANWCLVRGVNLLIPHAFYYSIRGPRRDERPPQVGGVGCSWWDQFKPFADHCSRLSWLNTDSQHVCRVAILAEPDHCPWQAAKVCFENQIDFNYLSPDHLDLATIDSAGVHIAGMSYGAIIAEVPPPTRLTDSPLLIRYQGNPSLLVERLHAKVGRDVQLDRLVPALRVRHVRQQDTNFYLLFNESREPLSTTVEINHRGVADWIDTASGKSTPAASELHLDLPGYGVKLLRNLPSCH